MCGAGVLEERAGNEGNPVFCWPAWGLEHDCFAALACCVGIRDFCSSRNRLFGAVDGKKFCKTSHRKLSIRFYSAEFETYLRSIDVGFGSVLLSRLLLL